MEASTDNRLNQENNGIVEPFMLYKRPYGTSEFIESSSAYYKGISAHGRGVFGRRGQHFTSEGRT